MAIPTSVVRANLKALSPLLYRAGLDAARALQARTGEIMRLKTLFEADLSDSFKIDSCEAVWAVPRLVPSPGCILYLHGGGYCVGDIEYCAGFGSSLAAVTKRRVLCCAYRLAPEFPFPCALEDALSAYEHIIEDGYSPSEIIVSGDSAGGGLAVCLCHKLRQRGYELPAGLVLISPWTDLAMTGGSILTNSKLSPTLTPELLEVYANCYAGDDRQNPLVSPLYGDFEAYPPTRIYVGGEELLLSDSLMLHDKLIKAGIASKLHIEDKLWHNYPLYNIKEAEWTINDICDFIGEVLVGEPLVGEPLA